MITIANLKKTNEVTIPINSIAKRVATLPPNTELPPDYRHPLEYCLPPIDQSACGACYAIAVTSILHDRLAYFYQHVLQQPSIIIPELSLQYLLNCSRNSIVYSGRAGTNNSCDGGFAIGGFAFCKTCGIPTAAELPFVSGGCEAQGVCSRQQKACPGIPAQVYKCDSYYFVSLYETFGQVNANEFVETMTAPQRALNSQNIQAEIWTRGPVACIMNVYSDFQGYWNRGTADTVYQLGWDQPTLEPVFSTRQERILGDKRWTKTQPGPLGLYVTELHAFVIVGWGVNPAGVEYWLCRNSWGPTAGPLRNGHFKVLRGENVCGLESNVCACWFDAQRPFLTTPGDKTWDINNGMLLPSLPSPLLTKTPPVDLAMIVGYTAITALCATVGVLAYLRHK